MPQHNFPSNTGDLLIEITVKFPSSVTEEQKEGREERGVEGAEEMKRG